MFYLEQDNLMDYKTWIFIRNIKKKSNESNWEKNFDASLTLYWKIMF